MMMSRLIGENLRKSYLFFSKLSLFADLENLRKKYSFFSNYLPLPIWTLKICNHDILKSIAARSFKLGQLIEDDE